jgi:hypothetical protein
MDTPLVSFLQAHAWVAPLAWIMLAAVGELLGEYTFRAYSQGKHRLVTPEGGQDPYAALFAAGRAQRPQRLLWDGMIALVLLAACTIEVSAPGGEARAQMAVLGGTIAFFFFPQLSHVIGLISSMPQLATSREGTFQVRPREMQFQYALARTERLFLFAIAAAVTGSPWLWGGAAGFAWMALRYYAAGAKHPRT